MILIILLYVDRFLFFVDLKKERKTVASMLYLLYYIISMNKNVNSMSTD